MAPLLMRPVVVTRPCKSHHRNVRRRCRYVDTMLIIAAALLLTTMTMTIIQSIARTTTSQHNNNVPRLARFREDGLGFRQNSRREQQKPGIAQHTHANANANASANSSTTPARFFRDAIACPQHQEPITFANVLRRRSNAERKYRLGDVVKFYGSGGHAERMVNNRIKPCRRFNHSIACSYVRMYRHSGKYPNMEVLDEVTPLVEPRPEAVMHLRLGDVAKGDCWNKDCIIETRSGNKIQYQFTEKDYDTIRDELKDLGTITIVANPSHLSNPSTIAWSEKYINHVMAYLRRLGVCPVYRGIRDADDDFAFATSAKVFVQGGGGYSRFMAKLVMKRGGRVHIPK